MFVDGFRFLDRLWVPGYFVVGPECEGRCVPNVALARLWDSAAIEDALLFAPGGGGVEGLEQSLLLVFAIVATFSGSQQFDTKETHKLRI